jgi:hypothetical protein
MDLFTIMQLLIGQTLKNMDLSLAHNYPMIIAGALNDRGHLINADQNCIIGYMEQNLGSAFWNPFKELIEVWDDANFRKQI